MSDDDDKTKYMQDVARGIELGAGASRAMGHKSSVAYIRARLREIAVTSRECSQAHDQLTQIIEKGLKADDAELSKALVPLIDAGIRCVIARNNWIAVYEKLVREAQEASRCSGGIS